MVGAIIQARMGSSRLPGKVLLSLSGEPVLVRVVQRLAEAANVDTVIVATSTDAADDAVAELCAHRGYTCFRGSREDVLSRYFEAARQYAVDTIIRITSDCPLVDPLVVDQCVSIFGEREYDYVSNIKPGRRTFPRGLDCEVFSARTLERAHEEATMPHEREHVTPYIWNRPDVFRIGKTVAASEEYARPYRLTLDYPEDYALLSHVYDHFYRAGSIIRVPEVLRYLDDHPELVALNAFREKDHQKYIAI